MIPLYSASDNGIIEGMEYTEKPKLIITGIIIGLAAVVLTLLGNPGNMGFCIACFLRDTAGAMHFHTAAIVEYVRPEIIGIIIGAFSISIIRGDFRPRGGSSPVLRFIIAAIVMMGALVFLGCPLRMVLRLGGGDLNALVGLLGFAAGIGVGCVFINNGFTLGKAERQSAIEGVALPSATVLLFVLFLAVPSLFLFSETGPGSMHAPVAAALGIRDMILIRDFTLISGFAAIFLASLVGNIAAGSFHLGFQDQPVSHPMHLWNFLGMFAVGLGSVMLGGCPLRQLILAAEGSSDSASAVLGMIAGAAISHNFSLASSANAGPGLNGKVALVGGIIILLAIAVAATLKGRKE